VIIPSLIDYYERVASDPESGIAPFGWSRQKVAFKVVIESNGGFFAIQDARREETVGKKTYTKPSIMTVPGQSKPTGSGINPCFLWDNAAYMLGLGADARGLGEKADSARVRQSFEAFREWHLALEREVDDEQFSAVCGFLRSWDPAERRVEGAKLAEYLPGFGVFQVRGHAEPVHERPRVLEYWNGAVARRPGDDDDISKGQSLITGGREVLARLHEPKIKGVSGAQSSGAAVVSFNLDAFESYGKSQGFNAPIGVHDAFRYCTALNYLLEQRHRRVSIGEDTFVYWAERPAPLEDGFDAFLGGSPPEDTSRVGQVNEALKRASRGLDTSKQLGDPGTGFFVLGLSPNASRLHVRFWLKSTIGELSRRLSEHLEHLELQGAPDHYRTPSIRDIVGETLPLKDGRPDHERADKGLVASVTRAILKGGPYPDRLLTGVIERARAEGFAPSEGRMESPRTVAHRRASIIKACLLRCRGSASISTEAPVSLNPEHPDAAYQIGRLFALLEKTQEEGADGKLNKTIKDSYFASASSTPAAVLPRLLTLHSHHLRKIEQPGRRVQFEKAIGEVQSRIHDGYPRFLKLQDRGLFFLGYYHQRTELFTRKDKPDNSD